MRLRVPARLALGLGLWLVSSTAGLGHDLFTAFIQHRVALTVGARHVDVAIQLTFFEDGSEHERAHMDTDRDGRVSRAEIECHLKQTETRLAQAVKLRAAGELIELTPLCAPQIDLLGNDRVGRGHHQLTLRFFAPTPRTLPAGAELVVEERLWPEVRALIAVQVEGREGCRLEALPPGDPLSPPVREGEMRTFKARILTLPSFPPVQQQDPQATRTSENPEPAARVTTRRAPPAAQHLRPHLLKP